MRGVTSTSHFFLIEYFQINPQNSNTHPSRDDKRYTERKNKTERARRKKEDITRVRSLVDLALAVDPRMKRIKQEEKEAREAKKKKGKVNGAPSKAQLEEQKRKEEEEAKRKEEEEKVGVVIPFFFLF